MELLYFWKTLNIQCITYIC